MVNRYKDHPALLGWYLHHGYTNENNYPRGPTLRHGSIGGMIIRGLQNKGLGNGLEKKYNNNNVSSFQKAWNNSPVTFENAEMPQPFYDYIFSPYIDIYHPGVTDDLWENPIRRTILYNFVKYYETRGKVTFIKWEGDQKLTLGNLKPLKGCAEFARKTGTGIALWEGNIHTEDDAEIQPEFTDIQMKAVAETFHSTPERRLKKAVLQ